MNLEVQDNDDVLFDRLVDGELSADQRRQLIASLDDRADGWRRCALAFLEAQSWGSTMRRMVQEPTAPAARVVEAASVNAAAPTGRRRRMEQVGVWLVTAASLLVAFSLGWQLKHPDATPLEDLAVSGPGAGAIPAGGALLGERHAAAAHDPDAVTLVVRDRNGGQRSVEVPLVEGERLGDEFGGLPQWADPATRKRLADQGIGLQAKRRYAPLYFQQRDQLVPMIIPVDDAVVTPVSRPVY